MRSLVLLAAATLALAVLAVDGATSKAKAVILDFEVGCDGACYLNNESPNYGGLTWDTEFRILSQDEFNLGYGNTGNFPSGDEAAYNGSGALVLQATSGAPIMLTSAQFRGWDNNDAPVDYTATSVTVTGFLNSAEVGSWTTSLTGGVWTTLLFGNTSVDAFTITSSAAENWWLMDNLAFDRTSAVPVPAALPLFAAGLGVVGLVARRRKQRALAAA